MTISNIFANIPQPSAEEFFETILQHPNIKIERIVSHGHTSPENFSYDQDTNEWVMVVKGHARLLFEGETAPVDLTAGDYLNIPAHQKHRVESTSPDEDTIWLAIHY